MNKELLYLHKLRYLLRTNHGELKLSDEKKGFFEKVEEGLTRLAEYEEIMKSYKRLTKTMPKSQSWCGYEVKKAKWKDLVGLEPPYELEMYVDTDLSCAIDKLGELEDIYGGKNKR